jgi:hypothetical protein
MRVRLRWMGMRMGMCRCNKPLVHRLRRTSERAIGKEVVEMDCIITIRVGYCTTTAKMRGVWYCTVLT